MRNRENTCVVRSLDPDAEAQVAHGTLGEHRKQSAGSQYCYRTGENEKAEADH